MIHYAPLKKLPDGIRIPESLKDRFWYDRDRQCLAFDGPMYKATFDRLEGLSADFEYRRALEKLFRDAVPATRRPFGLGRRRASAVAFLLAIGLVATAAALWPVWSRLIANR